MRALRLALVLAALSALLGPRPASARTAIGLGADYVIDPDDGAFLLTLAIENQLARNVTIGARFGGLAMPDPTRFGVPVDLRLRLRASGVYADALVGPWFVFDDGEDTLRFHAAFGFGLLTRSMSFGLEIGWLDPSSMIGVRLAFPL